MNCRAIDGIVEALQRPAAEPSVVSCQSGSEAREVAISTILPQIVPQPISTAPQEEDWPLLLFCPDQGGWHTGVWFWGKWLAYIDTSTVLEPSHWLPVPPDPPGVE
jgi:hypothetical protein